MAGKAAPDPMGTGLVGLQSGMERVPLCKPLIRYRDLVMEVDVYPLPGLATAPGVPQFEIVLLCPRCSTPDHPHHLRITSDRKHIELEMVSEHSYDGARLSVEGFECTWEAGLERGSGLCRWKVAIDKNVAKDA